MPELIIQASGYDVKDLTELGLLQQRAAAYANINVMEGIQDPTRRGAAIGIDVPMQHGRVLLSALLIPLVPAGRRTPAKRQGRPQASKRIWGLKYGIGSPKHTCAEARKM